MATENDEILRQLSKAREPKIKKSYKGIAKKSAKKIAKEAEEKEFIEKDKEFYEIVWANSPHVCRECGRGLGKTFQKWFAHHLLPKARYPQFRHCYTNVVLLCLEDHSKVETNIYFAPKIKELTLNAERECLKWLDEEIAS